MEADEPHITIQEGSKIKWLVTFRGMPSYSLHDMMTILTSLSQSMFTKSTTLSGIGPWAAMYCCPGDTPYIWIFIINNIIIMKSHMR